MPRPQAGRFLRLVLRDKVEVAHRFARAIPRVAGLIQPAHDLQAYFVMSAAHQHAWRLVAPASREVVLREMQLQGGNGATCSRQVQSRAELRNGILRAARLHGLTARATQSAASSRPLGLAL